MSEESYPSYEDFVANTGSRPTQSMSTLRLRWCIAGPISEAIRLLDDPTNAASEQQPYQSGSNLHPIATEPITEPPVSSITVLIDALNQWEYGWEEAHEHADEDDPETRWTNDDNGVLILQHCCGEDRPPGPPPSVIVRPSASTYVTVHDYITTLHHWLLTMRDSLLRALGLFEGPCPPEPLTKDTVLYLVLHSLKLPEIQYPDSAFSFGTQARVAKRQMSYNQKE